MELIYIYWYELISQKNYSLNVVIYILKLE